MVEQRINVYDRNELPPEDARHLTRQYLNSFGFELLRRFSGDIGIPIGELIDFRRNGTIEDRRLPELYKRCFGEVPLEETKRLLEGMGILE